MATSETNTSGKAYPSGAAPFRAAPGEELVGDDATAQVIQEILNGKGAGIDEATKKFPGRGGAPMAKTTINRHINHGVRLPNGSVVKLAAAKFGSKLYTSYPAIARFMLALTSAGLPTTTSLPPPTTSAGATPDARRVKKANAKLEAAGA
jgi:hypothetical protein